VNLKLVLRRSAYLSFSLALASIGVLSTPNVAVAHDHVPPKTQLVVNGQTLQRGRLTSYCWISPGGSPGTYVQACADGPPNFPRGRAVDVGTRVTIRVLKEERPRELSIWSYSGLNRYGGPASATGEELRYKRRRVRMEGASAWDFSFVLSNTPRHYYLEVFGVWEDEDGAGDQDASWDFHVRTSS
jgi:hypothetical protein